MGFLLDSFAKTTLDLTDKSPLENFLDKDTITNYPSTQLLYNQNRKPGLLKSGRFAQIWNPKIQYLDFVSKETGDLKNYLDQTDFDTSESGPSGFKFSDVVTNYPSTTTGIPSTESSTEPAKNFYQKYVGDVNGLKTYLEENPIKGEGKLKSTLANTNLDVSDERPEGGIPYEKKEDPTVYPVLTHRNSSTLGNFPIEGKSAQKFKHPFNPQNTYLDFMAPYIQTNNVITGG